MAVKVVYDYYSEVCGNYVYGKEFLNLPTHIIDALNDVMDGVEFKKIDGCNPDNLYINSYCYICFNEVLIDYYGLSREKYDELVEQNTVLEFVKEHDTDIQEKLSADYTVLGYDGSEYHVLA